MKKITFAALAVPLMWVLLLFQLFSNNKLYAQERTVLSGVVKSADGTPMEGVTVWQQGTDNGIQTNETGHYTLQINNSIPVTFEYLGYKTHTAKPAGNILNVTLQTDEDTLEEVVINAGYYTVKDKERTGSISKITAKEIGQQPVANPLAAMQGRMAGVNITQSSGTPGGGFDIQIRGRNSLRTEGNAPLYIVDGVPYPSQSMSDYTVSGQVLPYGNISPLNKMNPNDIESIEVLKDADATAIYGSRGSNGVVLITTKKGSADKTTFSLQSVTSVSTVSKFMDLMDTEEYLQMRRDAYANDGITEYPANAYDVNGTWDEHRYTDWQKEFIGRKAVSQNTQFSIGGGNGTTTYLLSAGHRNDETVFIGDFGYKRTGFMLNIGHQSKDKRFSLQGNLQKSDQRNKLMATDFTSQMFLAPNAPDLYLSDGSINWENNTFDNPLANLNAAYSVEIGDIAANVSLKYDISSKLDAKLNMGLTETDLREYKTVPHTIYNPSYGLTSKNSSLTQSVSERNNWIMEPQLNWISKNEKGSWNVLVGATIEERREALLGIIASNFTSNDFIMNAANAVTQRINKDTEAMYRYMALFGRINYIHQDKYIVNLTARRDGSSRFGSSNKFGNFGAVATAWLFSREKIFDNSNWLNFGKLRVGYGIAGSDLIGDYQYLNTFAISSYKYDVNVGLDVLRLYNPEFSWENNKKLETALELELFNGRIATAISWYRNRSSNQLVGIPLPGTTGFPSVQANLNATVENSGWEFTLRTSNISNQNFNWNMSANLSIPRNKLIAFPNLEESTYANTYEIGSPITIRKTYKYKGINQESGLYEFEDENNDGQINLLDRTNVMDVGVRWFGGISNEISYKNFSLNFHWQFVKQKVLSPDYYGSISGANRNKPAGAMDYFSETNKNALYQKPTSGYNPAAIVAYQNYLMSDAMVIDGSYIRLKSLQLQYTFKPFRNNVTVNTYAQGFNLFTLSKYWGNDPETIGAYLPALRTIAVGFNINF